MLKKLPLLLLALSFSFLSKAQMGSCPKFYLGLSSGLNNPAGLVGLNIDVPVTSNVSLGTGGGISSWGYKFYGEGRYYFRECNRGWALGAAFVYNTGLPSLNLELGTNIGTQTVLVDLEPVPAVTLSGYHFFNMGRAGHRFYLQFGWSQRFVDKAYTIQSGVTLNTEGEQAMQILTPGGVVFGVGFSFALAK